MPQFKKNDYSGIVIGQLTIINVSENKGKEGDIWDLEKEFHKKHSDANLKYEFPRKYFNGNTECFTDLINEFKI